MSGSAERPCRSLTFLLFAALAAGAAPRDAAQQVDPANLREVVTHLATIGPRTTGSEGARGAAVELEGLFTRYGLQQVQRLDFQLPVPVPQDAKLVLPDRSIPLGTLAPSYVRLNALPEQGVTGPLVYAGDGSLAPLKGLPLDGAIVLVDFNCGQRWIDLATLGAAAIVFVEPPDGPAVADRGEARRKLLKVPVDVPRFYLDQAGFRQVAAAAGQTAPGRPFTLAQAGLGAKGDWRQALGTNVLGFLPGSDPTLAKECLLVSGYYDSTSTVLEVGPGAEQAGGIATLLEAIRILGQQRPKRSILFVAMDGHFQGLAGARSLAYLLRRDHTRDRWVDARKMMQEEDQKTLAEMQKLHDGPPDPRLPAAAWDLYKLELEAKMTLFQRGMEFAESFYSQYDYVLHIAVDLSSGSDKVGLFASGHFYTDEKLTRFLAPLGKRFVDYAKNAGATNLQDCITPAQDKAWDAWVPDQFATDAEPFTEAARPSLSLFTISDSRPRVATPWDTADRVRYDQLLAQAKTVVAVVAAAADDTGLRSEGLKRLGRMPYQYVPVDGMIYEFERKRTFLPNTPVPHALIAMKNPAISMMGVNPDIYVQADLRGDFRAVGYRDDAALKIDAYATEAGSGKLIYAPDLGPEGEVKYPRDAKGRQRLRRPVIVFPCAPVSLFDLVDERYFATLQQIYLYDARTDSEPRSFGYELPVHSPPAKIRGTVSASYVEPMAVVYAPRETRVKITMGMGLLGLRLILTNATVGTPQGTGFDPVETPRLARTSYQAASDMWLIDDTRMQRQKSFGITSLRLGELHARAQTYLQEAGDALKAGDWERHLSSGRIAWAYEARAYPDVQGTEADTIKGVLFYLALLLPFAFFGERLLFGSPRIKDQIIRTVAIFMVVYIALRYVHPAFQLLDTPWIILLGFIIMSLASVVIALVTRRFNEELEALKQAAGGQHSADVSRAGTLGAAFTLGISNMRRRALRTTLTAVTLTLLTFTVLSFTSVKSSLRANARPASGKPVYPGLLVRDPVWSALQAPTARILETQFHGQGVVSPRSWLVSSQLDKQMKLPISNGTTTWLTEHGVRGEAAARMGQLGTPPAPLTVNAILGATAFEPQISGLGIRLVGGRWLAPGEQNTCVVPQSVASKLDVGPGSTGDKLGLGYGAIEVFGSRFAVVGVIADPVLDATMDLDGEPLTPVDFSQLEPEKLRVLQEQQANRLKLGNNAAPPVDRYVHYKTEGTIILPYDRVVSLGGTLRSVAIRFADPKAVAPAATAMMDRFELSAYAGEGDHVSLYSSVGTTSVSGLETVLIPLLIAALIVLNTMLGAVMERLHEIGIFSSIGLAPAHVAMLFLAESCVFANLGVIIGYLGGQTLAKLLYLAQSHHLLGGLAGLSLNYSSTSAVGVAVVIIGTVLLSTLYPARKAARLATPDVERRWRLPQPEGNRMVFGLPFMLTGRDGIACNVFLKEYFDGYVDFAGGDFYTDGTELTRHGGGFRLALTVWLAPYDLGVSQRVELITVPEPDDPKVNRIEIHLDRISGDDNGWRRTNWLFINILRQQFLIWRTISPAARATYAEQGYELLGPAPEPAEHPSAAGD